MKNKQLVQPSTQAKTTLEGKEVQLSELESLCGSFDKRPRGCNAETDNKLEAASGFSSTGDNDDVLF